MQVKPAVYHTIMPMATPKSPKVHKYSHTGGLDLSSESLYNDTVQSSITK